MKETVIVLDFETTGLSPRQGARPTVDIWGQSKKLDIWGQSKKSGLTKTLLLSFYSDPEY